MAIQPGLVQTLHVETVDGRRLRAEVAGDSHRVVLGQVGSPNAGLLHHDWVQDAAGRGLTLITTTGRATAARRAGPGGWLADCAADVRRISEAVGSSDASSGAFRWCSPRARLRRVA